MRHRMHRFQLGVKAEHREAMMASLATHLFTHGRIQTTLAKAKALRPFAEKIVTLAKEAHTSEVPARKLFLRRLAVAKLRSREAAKELFDRKVTEFLKRPGGYVRITKLAPRLGDATPMAVIELLREGDVRGKTGRGAPAAPAETAAAG